jgi:PAS domain S-box-containing protein
VVDQRPLNSVPPPDAEDSPPARPVPAGTESPPDEELRDVLGEDRTSERATVYWLIGLLLLGGVAALAGSPGTSSPEIHTAVEAVSTVLAFVVGALALVRYYSRRQSTFLFIGTGFLGTGILDAYHGIVSAGLLGLHTGADPVNVSAWSWTASRLYLSLFLLVSLLGWRTETRKGGMAVRDGSIYLTAVVVTILVFVFFAVAPLTSAYSSTALVGRPAEFVPAVFFLVTLIGYYRKGTWRRDSFEHWLLISLLIGFLVHALFMALAREPFDAMYNAAHVLKLVSYAAVLCGLMVSVFVTFRREEVVLDAVRGANEALAREVAVRRDAERVLQESEERLQHFLDTAHDLIQSTAPDGAILYVNRAWQDTLGYDDESLGGTNLLEIVAPGSRVKWEAALEQALGGEPLTHMLLELVAADGRIVLCSGSSTVHVVDGKPVAIQSILRDVTEQRKAERELAASRANLQAIVENTGDAIWSVDPEHRLITFNAAFALALEARTGREPRTGESPEDLYDPEQAAWYRSLYDRVLQGKRFSDTLVETVLGQVRDIEIYCNPIQDSGGVVGGVMFGKDITRRRIAEEALLAAKEEAVAANRAKSQFLANMSHELRTPLNSVIGFANVLLKNKQANLEDQQIGFLDRILANGRHLLSLINEVLDLAKIEAGRMDVVLERVDLAELVDETLGQLEGRVADRDVKLVAELPARIEPLETDSAKLKQVIINLVGNALKFTERGSVTVQVETDSDGDVPRAIAVRDTGIGIPPDRLSAIFDAFQQADGSTSRRFGGTGLGLAISRSLCRLLGYDITVESVVDEGSTFTIQLARPEEPSERPRVDTVPAPEEVELTPPAMPENLTPEIMSAFRVLVVDDQPESRLLITHFLEGFGCEVITAESGESGVTLAHEHQPDLITLDLVMPGMTGWEALRAFKDDPVLRPIPVVIVSAVATQGGRGRLMGAVDVLAKPVDRDDLLRVIWRNLARHRQGRVLVVDDDEDTRMYLEDWLEDSGLEVVLATNGHEALQLVERQGPDAVVLDLMMPVMDGMGFLERLRESTYHSGLPVIVLTAKDVSREEWERLEDLASTVLRKDDQVEQALQDVLGSLFPIVTA